MEIACGMAGRRIAAAWVAFAVLGDVAMAADEPAVTASPVASVLRFQPGVPFRVGVHLRMARNWYTYWLNPGDAGLATSVRWTLPEGFRAGPVEWPAPRRFVGDGLASYGYVGEVVLPVKIVPPPVWPAGRPAVLRARVDWLACKDECVPGRAGLEWTVGSGSRAEPAPGADAIAASLARIPRADPAVSVEAIAETGAVRLRVTGLAGGIPVLFVPERGGIVKAAATPGWTNLADGFGARLPLEAGVRAPDRMTGVLLLDGRSGPPAVLLDFALPRRTVPENGTEGILR
ncbi:MAG: hypothetical protein KJ579_09985 [Verrucomicrobia bacterium]|nr:hypothetical protein [Verrucomicrobiota bacterium]